jgi:hypothetical protein
MVHKMRDTKRKFTAPQKPVLLLLQLILPGARQRPCYTSANGEDSKISGMRMDLNWIFWCVVTFRVVVMVSDQRNPGAGL